MFLFLGKSSYVEDENCPVSAAEVEVAEVVVHSILVPQTKIESYFYITFVYEAQTSWCEARSPLFTEPESEATSTLSTVIEPTEPTVEAAFIATGTARISAIAVACIIGLMCTQLARSNYDIDTVFLVARFE